MSFKCEICEREFESIKSLCGHIKAYHAVSKETYYAKYVIKLNDIPQCPICEKELKLRNLKAGFLKTCSIGCAAKLKF